MNAEILRKFLPANLAQAVSGYVWRQIHVGCSTAQVFHLGAENEKSLYLKITVRISGNSLVPEKLKLDWLQNQLFVPKVVLFAEDENTDYLLLSEISGVNASDDFFSENVADVIEQLAKGLKKIHSLPIKNCPFNARLDYKIELAKERMLKGLVDENDFDDERAGRRAEDLFQELLATKPAEKQNEKFIHWHKTKRPFVHLKMAISLDGRIATRTGDSRWITGEESRKKSHELRHEYDAILIGANTAIVDNPSLTDRSDKPRRRKLVRVVLDDSLRISLNSQLVLTAKETPTIVFTENRDNEKIKDLKNEGVEVVQIAEGARNLFGVLQELGKRELTSVLVEGGTQIAGAFYDAKLIDKLTFFIAPIVIGGQNAPTAIGGQGATVLANAMRLQDLEIKQHGADIEVTGYPFLTVNGER